jgi:drug/metabolite transporter (DMT)-like permease
MSYLTWREYVRSGWICLGALMVIGGAILALLPGMGIELVPGYDLLIGAGVAILGLIFIIVGFAFTRKKRDSVLTKVDTKRLDDTPPPPPPPD